MSSTPDEIEEVDCDYFGFKHVKDFPLIDFTAFQSGSPVGSYSLLSIERTKGDFAAADDKRLFLGSTVTWETKSIEAPHITHLSFTHDGGSILVAFRGGIAGIAVFDLTLKQKRHVPTPAITHFQPNPADDTLAVIADSHAFIVNVSTTNALKIADEATAMSWSRKGKQLVVALRNGSLQTFLPTGEPKMSFASLHVQPVESIHWIDNVTFFVALGSNGIQCYIFTQPNSWLHVTDPTPPFGDKRRTGSHQVLQLSSWNPNIKDLLVITYSKSSDVGVVTRSTDDGKWKLLILDDARRATVPDFNDKEASPIGLAVDLSSTTKLLIGDKEVSPLPRVWFLDQGGRLRGYYLEYDDAIRVNEAFPEMVNAKMDSDMTEPQVQFKSLGEILSSNPTSEQSSRTTSLARLPDLSATPLSRELPSVDRDQSVSSPSIEPSLRQPEQGPAPGPMRSSQLSFGQTSLRLASSPLSTLQTPTSGQTGPAFGQSTFGRPAFAQSSFTQPTDGQPSSTSTPLPYSSPQSQWKTQSNTSFLTPSLGQPSFAQPSFGQPSLEVKPTTTESASSESEEIEDVDCDYFGFKHATDHALPDFTPFKVGGPLGSSALLSVNKLTGLFTAGDDKHLFIGNLTTWDIKSVEVPLITHLSFTHDGGSVLVASQGGIALFDLNLKQQGHVPTPAISQFQLNPANDSVAVIADSKVFVINVSTASVLKIGNEATAMSWSRKGKQLVVASRNGLLQTFLPTGERKASFNVLDRQPVESIHWIDNTTFFVALGSNGVQCHIFTQPNSWLHVIDPAPPFGDKKRTSSHQILQLSSWNPNIKDLLVITYSKSSDVGVVTRSTDDGKWKLLILDDARRATVPDFNDKEASPIGLAVDLSSTTKLLIGDKEVSPLPRVWFLDQGGRLRGYYLEYDNAIRINQRFSEMPKFNLETPNSAEQSSSNFSESASLPPQSSFRESSGGQISFGKSASSPSPSNPFVSDSSIQRTGSVASVGFNFEEAKFGEKPTVSPDSVGRKEVSSSVSFDQSSSIEASSSENEQDEDFLSENEPEDQNETQSDPEIAEIPESIDSYEGQRLQSVQYSDLHRAVSVEQPHEEERNGLDGILSDSFKKTAIDKDLSGPSNFDDSGGIQGSKETLSMAPSNTSGSHPSFIPPQPQFKLPGPSETTSFPFVAPTSPLKSVGGEVALDADRKDSSEHNQNVGENKDLSEADRYELPDFESFSSLSPQKMTGSGIEGAFSSLDQQVTSEFQILHKNLELLAKFVSSEKQSQSAGDTDFSKSDAWRLSDAALVSKLSQKWWEDSIELKQENDKNEKAVSDQKHFLIRLETRQIEIARLLRAKSEPEYMNTIRVKILPPDLAFLQQKLRRGNQECEALLRQLETDIGNVKVAISGRTMPPPDVESITHTMARISSHCQQRLTQMDYLERQIRRLLANSPERSFSSSLTSHGRGHQGNMISESLDIDDFIQLSLEKEDCLQRFKKRVLRSGVRRTVY